jgi:hypothetical protein
MRNCRSFVSLDYLIRATEQREPHGNAERLGRLEVDDQFERGDCCTGSSAGFSMNSRRSSVVNFSGRLIGEESAQETDG